MPTPDQEAKWLPVAQQILDRWGVKHESLKGTIAAEIAGIIAEERERCAKIVEGEVFQEHYRTWPQIGSGNRSNDREVTQHCILLAAVIRAT